MVSIVKKKPKSRTQPGRPAHTPRGRKKAFSTSQTPAERTRSRKQEAPSTLAIWNPGASTTAGWPELRATLERRPGVLLRETSSDREASDLVRDCVSRGTKLVIAAGGDGTLNAVANGLAEAAAGATLAILPLGTGNDFARTLGIPADPTAALALIENPMVRNVDLVRAESASGIRHFVNMAGGGNSHKLSEHLDDDIKQRWGPFCYVRGVINVLTQLERHQITIRFDDRPAERFDAFNIFLANGQTCGGGLRVAPLANPEDGLLDVMIVLDGGPLDVATLAARFLVNDFLASEMVIHRRAGRVQIDSDPKTVFVADGDAGIELPATFTVLPGVLRMVVGADYAPEFPVGDTVETEPVVTQGQSVIEEGSGWPGLERPKGVKPR